MVSLIWQGAEIPSNKELLLGSQVSRLGVGFKGLKARVHREIDEILENFPPDVDIHAYPGMNNKTMSVDDHLALAEEYEQFVGANVDRLTSWVEYDAPSLGADFVLKRRKEFYDKFDDMCFRPVWNYDSGPSVLEDMADRYPHVVVGSKALTMVPGLQGLLTTLQRKYETSFHVFGLLDFTDVMGPGAAPIGDVYTSAWTSPMRHGETIVWEYGKLHRYPKKMQDQARAQHRALVSSLGFDSDKIVEGNAKELSKLAIWSLQQLEESGPMRPSLTLVAGTKEGNEGGNHPDRPSSEVDTKNNDMRHTVPTRREKRHPSEKRVIPSVSMSTEMSVTTDDAGNAVAEEVPVVRSTGTSMRHCDSCFIASNCPEYRPNADCAFEFSPQIRNREQLIAMLQTVIETQTGRVFFGKLAEDVNGGYPDPTVGKEIDRLMKLVQSMKDIEDNKEFVRLTMERRGNAGILSQIFGDRAAAAIAPPEQS